jgi:hypothetical protein
MNDDEPTLTVAPSDYDWTVDYGPAGCELCRALLALAESAVANRAAAEGHLRT